MVNSLDLIMWISMAIVILCVLIIIIKFIRYFHNKKEITIYQENNSQDIKILELKLPEIKLRNKGHSLDENISFIFNDESVSFSMEWGDIFEQRDNL